MKVERDGSGQTKATTSEDEGRRGKERQERGKAKQCDVILLEMRDDKAQLDNDETTTR